MENKLEEMKLHESHQNTMMKGNSIYTMNGFKKKATPLSKFDFCSYHI